MATARWRDAGHRSKLVEHKHAGYDWTACMGGSSRHVSNEARRVWPCSCATCSQNTEPNATNDISSSGPAALDGLPHVAQEKGQVGQRLVVAEGHGVLEVKEYIPRLHLRDG